jgi:hypothetical protein
MTAIRLGSDAFACQLGRVSETVRSGESESAASNGPFGNTVMGSATRGSHFLGNSFDARPLQHGSGPESRLDAFVQTLRYLGRR